MEPKYQNRAYGGGRGAWGPVGAWGPQARTQARKHAASTPQARRKHAASTPQARRKHAASTQARELLLLVVLVDRPGAAVESDEIVHLFFVLKYL